MDSLNGIAAAERPADKAATEPMPFESILFRTATESTARQADAAPSFFRDLNLDQIVAAITSGREPYDLAPFFHQPLANLDAVAYRQAIMRDLENPEVMQAIQAFSERMRQMREHLARSGKLHYRYEKERWFLAACERYCEAVVQLRDQLDRLELRSDGLRRLVRFLAEYVACRPFSTLATRTRTLTAGLAAIRYALFIKGNRVTVRPYDDEDDYGVAVERTFEKFRRGAVRDFRVRFPEGTGLNHVEAQVLEGVVRLNPDVFQALATFCVECEGYLDPRISRFDREVQFYVAYLGYIAPFRRAGLSFCYPQVSRTSKAIHARDTFDLALAGTRAAEKAGIVRNDFWLSGAERMLVVSGPNHGGKTTFARMFGQVHYLASLGCQVPGTHAHLFFFDRLFTHFEREERIDTLRGKLQDDLIRIRTILDEATPFSIVVLNEIFGSTTLQDAVYLSRKVVARLSELDLLAVCVTFLTELGTFNEKTVSIVGTVDERDPSIRTYRLERRPADGLAYALAIAEKHHVTSSWLSRRIEA